MIITIKLSDEHTISFRGKKLFQNTMGAGCAVFEVAGYESHEEPGGFSLGVTEKTPCYNRTEMFYFETFPRFLVGTQTVIGVIETLPQYPEAQFMSCAHCGWGGPTQ